MKKVYLFAAAIAFAACTVVSCSDTKKDGSAAGGAQTEEKAEPVEHPTVDTPLEQVEVKLPQGDLNEDTHKQLLDEYEAFIDTYSVLVEKAAQGDTAAYTKMTSMSRTVNDFAKQINKRRGQFSKEEQARYDELISRFTKVTMSLHGRLKKTPKS